MYCKTQQQQHTAGERVASSLAGTVKSYRQSSGIHQLKLKAKNAITRVNKSLEFSQEIDDAEDLCFCSLKESTKQGQNVDRLKIYVRQERLFEYVLLQISKCTTVQNIIWNSKLCFAIFLGVDNSQICFLA